MVHHSKIKNTSSTAKTTKTNGSKPLAPERIAKVIARAGLASRREAERMIEAGKVTLNGKKLISPAINVTLQDKIFVNGHPLPSREMTQIWRFHKPAGCVTTHKDPEGRQTAFDHLPEDLPRVISVGRLDYNTEGLLLLTNDGGLARHLELPATGWLRRYRVRARGSISQHKLDELKNGITIDGIKYGRIEAQLNRQDKSNIWMTVAIREGKNREIRRIFEGLGLAVNRLIRISYGPFMLGDLPSGQVESIKPKILIEQLGADIARQLGINPEDQPSPKKIRRKQGKDQLDSALRSKKPGRSKTGNPKGGQSLNFRGKKKFGHRSPDDDEGERSSRRQTGRRSRNANRSAADRREHRHNNKEDTQQETENRQTNRPSRRSSKQTPQNRRPQEPSRGKARHSDRQNQSIPRGSRGQSRGKGNKSGRS